MTKHPRLFQLSLLVLAISGFVPQIVLAQSVVVKGPAESAPATPNAAAESKTTTPKAVAAKKPSAEKLAAASMPSGTKPLTLAENAPSTYIVVKGDTLWDISGKFLKEPWRWPEIWNFNREQIKDPHWIYPGDVINLSFDANGNPRLSFGRGSGGAGGTARLSPGVRVDRFAQAIPSIPARDIAPFLSLPLVADEDALINAPKIIAADDGRVIVGAGDKIYVVAMKPEMGTRWQIYRPGKKLIDPDTKEILGYEAIYLGDAKVNKFGESTTAEVVKSTQEINKGDRLAPATESAVPSYVPHSPESGVKGKIISVLGGVSESAQYSVVVLNLGMRNGLEVGHVLAGMRAGATVSTKTGESTWGSFVPNFIHESNAEKLPSTVKLDDERNGLLFVFRVFDKVSYALVMSSNRPFKVGDVVQTP